MEQTGTWTDFLLIERATGSTVQFRNALRQARELAEATTKEIAWQVEFDIGPGEHVDVISAPSRNVARLVAEQMNNAPGLRAEVVALASKW